MNIIKLFFERHSNRFRLNNIQIRKINTLRTFQHRQIEYGTSVVLLSQYDINRLATDDSEFIDNDHKRKRGIHRLRNARKSTKHKVSRLMLRNSNGEEKRRDNLWRGRENSEHLRRLPSLIYCEKRR